MKVDMPNVRINLQRFLFKFADKNICKYVPFRDGYLKLVAQNNNFTYNVCDQYYEELYDADKTFSKENVTEATNEIVGDIKLLIWNNN